MEVNSFKKDSQKVGAPCAYPFSLQLIVALVSIQMYLFDRALFAHGRLHVI